MHYTPRIDQIEAVTRKVKRLGATRPEVGREPSQHELTPDVLDGAIRQVDAHQIRPSLGEASMVGSHADTDLQHSLAMVTLELGEARDTRLQPVTLIGLTLVTFEIRPPEVELFPARRRLPVSLDGP
jgi:hypothetical protein